MPQTRFHYLDHLRAFAMLFGILVHTTTLADFGFIEIVAPISDNFRMGVFYVLSGFFAGLLLERRSLSNFVQSRGLAIGLPFLVTLLLLNPITLWLVYNVHNSFVPLTDLPEILAISFLGSDAVSGDLVWHLHLWFLVSLFVYIPFAGPMRSAIRLITSIDILRRAATAVPDPFRITVLALAAAAAIMAMRLLSSLTLGQHETFWIVRATLTYAPWYALGLLCWQERALWERMHRIDPVLVFIVAALWITTANEDVSTPLHVFRRSVTVVAALCTLLHIFRSLLNRSIPAIEKVTNGAYSIYLLHYVVIYTLGTILIPIFSEGSIWLYWVVAGGTFAITYLFHRKAILRMPFLAFIFNGKPWTLAKAAK